MLSGCFSFSTSAYGLLHSAYEPRDDWSLFREMMRFIGMVIGALTIFCSGVGCARHLTPRPSTSSEPLTFTILSAGQDHTCGLTAGGVWYSWGANADGQHGI